MHKRLYFLDSHEVLYLLQFGFMKETPLPKLSYLLFSQSNILLAMVNVVGEFFLTCRKLLTL